MDENLNLALDTSLYHLLPGEKVIMVTRRGVQGALPLGTETRLSGFQIIEQVEVLTEDGRPVGNNAIAVIGRVRIGK
jgi:hypothetical protein